jgi:hypothetical protein
VGARAAAPRPGGGRTFAARGRGLRVRGTGACGTRPRGAPHTHLRGDRAVCVCAPRAHVHAHVHVVVGEGRQGPAARRRTPVSFDVGRAERTGAGGVVTIVPFRNSEFYRLFRRTLYVRKKLYIERDPSRLSFSEFLNPPSLKVYKQPATRRRAGRAPAGAPSGSARTSCPARITRRASWGPCGTE